MARKRATRSSSSERDSPLTKAEIKALRKEFGESFRNFTGDEWQEFETLLPRQPEQADNREVAKRPLGVFMVAIMKLKQWETDLGLPPASNLRDDARRMLAVAANYYWKNSAKKTFPRDSKRQLESSIEHYRRGRAGVSKLALGNVKELFLTNVIIDGLEKTRRDMRNGARGATGQLMSHLLLIWISSGGKVGQSTDPYSYARTGPLIRYLTFAYRVVKGRPPGDEGLRDHIRDFKDTMRMSASRRPRKKR